MYGSLCEIHSVSVLNTITTVFNARKAAVSKLTVSHLRIKLLSVKIEATVLLLLLIIIIISILFLGLHCRPMRTDPRLLNPLAPEFSLKF